MDSDGHEGRDSVNLDGDLQRIGASGYEVRTLLTKLDELQREEEISPQLAETIRIAMFQVASENLQGFRDKVMRSFPGMVKFFASQFDHEEFHLMKAAQSIEKKSEGVIKAGDIVKEFIAWQQKDED